MQWVWDGEQQKLNIKISNGLTIDELCNHRLVDESWKNWYLSDTTDKYREIEVNEFLNTMCKDKYRRVM